MSSAKPRKGRLTTEMETTTTKVDEVTKNALTPADKKKVAIVGFASNWQDAPWADEECEIWGLNELYMYFQKIPQKARADRWFEIHSRHSPTKGIPEHQDWLRKCPIPVYMHEHYEDIPNSVPYPKIGRAHV